MNSKTIDIEKKNFKVIFILSTLILIAWLGFLDYTPLLNFDTSVLATFENFQQSIDAIPFYLKIFNPLNAYLSEHSLLIYFILGLHFLTVLLFYILFEVKKEHQLGSFFLIFSPLTFYACSIQDIRFAILEVLAIVFGFVAFTSKNLKYRDILLLLLTIVGVFVDFSFILILAMFVVFSKDNIKNKIVWSLVLIGLFSGEFFLSNLWSGISVKNAEFVYLKQSSNIIDYIKIFLNSIIDFISGNKSIGLSFQESIISTKDLFIKSTCGLLLIFFLVINFRNKLLKILLYSALVLLFTFFISFNSTSIITSGQYFNSLSIKYSVLLGTYVGVAIYLSEVLLKNWKSYAMILVVLIPWINFINNASYNTYAVYRNEAPLFWGLLQSNSINFKKKFSEIYIKESKQLSVLDRNIADGLLNIKLENYLKLRGMNDTTLDAVYFLGTGKYIQMRETLGILYLNRVITNKFFLKMATLNNSRLEDRLIDNTIPLIYELLAEERTQHLAESIYILARLQYSSLKNDDMIRKLNDEFNEIFKPRK